MQKPWLMGIDLGGSGARCMLINRSSKTLVSASGNWEFSPAPGTFGTGFDIDLDQVWEIVGQACRDALQQADINPSTVAAIAVSAMRFSTVLLDEAGASLLAIPTGMPALRGNTLKSPESWGRTCYVKQAPHPCPCTPRLASCG